MPNPVFNIHQMSEGEDQNALTKPSAMDAFRERVNKFWSTYLQLENRKGEVPAALKLEYDAIMERGGRIRATIESITNTYDAVSEYVSDIFGFSGTASSGQGLDNVRWSDAFSGGQFNALPFVPLAVIAGASAFIVKWLKDAYTFERKLTEQKRLEEKGYDPAEAARIVNKTVTGPGLLNLGVNMKPLLILGGIGIGVWYMNRKGYI